MSEEERLKTPTYKELLAMSPVERDAWKIVSALIIHDKLQRLVERFCK